MNEQNNQNEVWKPIKLEGKGPGERYEVSSHGRLRKWDHRYEEWKNMKLSNIRGYKVYSYKADRSYTKLVHRLVAEVFLDRDNKYQDYVIHLDYDKANNHKDNLRWVTKDTMFAHHKLNPNYKKGRITNAKLTETEVMRIKMKLKRGKTRLYKIAKEFGITHTQLNRIRSGENWGHVKIE